jgi:hypothetical protein
MKQVFTRFSIVGASAFLSLAVGCASTEQTETLLSEAGFRSVIATDLSQRQLRPYKGRSRSGAEKAITLMRIRLATRSTLITNPSFKDIDNSKENLKPPNKATTRRFMIRPLTAYVGSCLTSNVPRANLWVPEVCRFSECEEMLILAMEVTGSDDRGLLKQAAGPDVEGEPDKLCVRPGQRGGGSGTGSRCKAGLAGGRLVIPGLLR